MRNLCTGPVEGPVLEEEEEGVRRGSAAHLSWGGGGRDGLTAGGSASSSPVWLTPVVSPPRVQGSAMPFGNTHNEMKLKYASDKEYPDLSQHNNHMAKILTPAMYELLRKRQTPSGFTLDDVIQTGIDNPGKKKRKKKRKPQAAFAPSRRMLRVGQCPH